MKHTVLCIALFTTISSMALAQSFTFDNVPDRAWWRSVDPIPVDGGPNAGLFFGTSAAINMTWDAQVFPGSYADKAEGRGKANGKLRYLPDLTSPSWIQFQVNNTRSVEIGILNYGHADPLHSFMVVLKSNFIKYDDEGTNNIGDPVPAQGTFSLLARSATDPFILSVPVHPDDNPESPYYVKKVQLYGPSMSYRADAASVGLRKTLGQTMKNEYEISLITEHLTMPRYVTLENVPEGEQKIVSLILYSNQVGSTANIQEVSILDKSTGRFPIASSGVTPVRYEIRADGYLNQQGEITLNGNTFVISDPAYGGDINYDNSVDLLDYFLLSQFYNYDAGYPDWLEVKDWQGIRPADADINEDESVDLLDYLIMSNAYNLSGDDLML